MARLQRIVLPGQPHLIIQRARGDGRVFLDASDGVFYRTTLADAARDANVALYAYALSPNEIRLLVTPHDSSGLANLMQGIGRRYVPWFNSKYACTGSPWEGRFRSTVIETGSQFLPCLQYVESLNRLPFQEGGQVHLALPSSAAHHEGFETDRSVAEHPAFWALGNTPFERQAAYRKLLDKSLSAAATLAISRAALNGWALGSESFVTMVSASSGRRAERALPGRPPKDPLAGLTGNGSESAS